MHCTSWELTASPLIAREIKRKLSSQLPMGPAMGHFPGRKTHFLGEKPIAAKGRNHAIQTVKSVKQYVFFSPWKVQNNKH